MIKWNNWLKGLRNTRIVSMNKIWDRIIFWLWDKIITYRLYKILKANKYNDEIQKRK